MIDRLEQLSLRYTEVEQDIQNPELVRDQKKYKEVMREHAYLSDVMESYEAYKK
ncbi:MAG: PCRF domain-containing protein, partial [Spirochaetaceae bacterium]|nr:PCRF domain-containing protein [Spirochaetaceae bacterium]